MTLQPKLRNPWLIIPWTYGLFVLAHTVLYLHFLIAGKLTGRTFADLASGSFESPVTILSQGLVAVVLGVPFLFLLVRLLWRRTRQWMGLFLETGPFVKGALLGLGAAAGTIAILFLTANARFTGLPTRFSITTLMMLVSGQIGWILFKTLLEEIIFRGMVTRELAIRWGWPVATLVGGLYFSVSHLIGMIPVLTLELAFGLLIAGSITHAFYVALYLRGGSLALPWGVHFGWNFAVASLAGTTMSGVDQSFGLFQIEMSGNRLLTGGEFGVEMSVVAVLVTLALTICIIKFPATLNLDRRHIGQRRRPGQLQVSPEITDPVDSQ